MVSKNSEAPLAATFGASIENNREGNIDMNIVARSDLNFQGKAIVPVTGMTGIWLTSAEIANALQYKSAKSVTNLFNQNSDEFTSGMTQVIESVTSGNYRKKVRVFSLRGAHLIAMFARTPKAKEFRRWVLDILDREVAHSPIAKQFSDEELVMLCYLQVWMEKSQQVSKKLYPAMRELGSDLTGKIRDIACETGYMTRETKKILLREAQNLDNENFVVSRAQPMLARLRGEGEWIH
ncbi:BRO family protein [Klebsiella pneumoniae]|uniref:BRO family protein n=1 Tax=Klebsiella pneumoniae TaxID=573 RepID=UPI0010823254|nr:BRO family protein [Klebsiella pneumoniae]VGC40446.1 Phage anti-repressor protein [Klebsiella pneumoniae]